MPLVLFGASGNYASALYIAAKKANALDKVESEILDLVEASKRSPTFSQFTKDSSVRAETRVKAIDEICGQAKFSDLTRNFLGNIQLCQLINIDTYIISFQQKLNASKCEATSSIT